MRGSFGWLATTLSPQQPVGCEERNTGDTDADNVAVRSIVSNSSSIFHYLPRRAALTESSASGSSAKCRVQSTPGSGFVEKMFSGSSAAILLFTVLGAVRCQQIPLRSRDSTQLEFSDAELNLGSKMLPDGVEIVSYLRWQITSRFYFMVEVGKTPLEIVVSPCDSSINVKIFLQNLPSEGSGPETDDEYDDLFRQYNSLARQSAETSLPVTAFTGNEVMRYSVESAHIGIYIIEATAEDRDCSVRMSASTSPFSDLIYPELPQDPIVTSRFVTRATVELSWKPSPASWRYGQPIEYCVYVNRFSYFPTHCAARAFKYGDAPPTAAPDAGFQFAWQRVSMSQKAEVHPGESQEREETETKDERPQKLRGSADEAVYRCVGNKTRFIFNEAVGNGVKYYFDVYAVNRNTNASATYTGTEVIARNEGKTVRLKDGKLTTVHLRRFVSERTFIYHLDRKSSDLTVQIHPCSGQLNMSVQAERGHVIKSVWNVSRPDSISMKDARPGQYVIHVVRQGVRPRSSSFRIFASSVSALAPYPTLPKDTRIKTFEKLNTCNAVTVAWMGTSNQQKYCLYFRPVLSKPTSSDVDPRRVQDRCLVHSDRPKSEKLLCRHFRATNDRKSVMTETVRKLKPRTTYEFTVYVVKQGGMSLPYDSLTVKTKDTC